MPNHEEAREGGLSSATLNLVTLTQSVSLNWKLALWLGWLESQFLGSTCLCLPKVAVIGMGNHARLFTWVLVIQTPVLIGRAEI